MGDRQSGGNDGGPAAAQQVARDRVEDGHHLTVVTGQLGEQRPGDRRRSGGFGMAGGVEVGGSSEERRQGVAATLVAQDEDELDAGGHLSGDVPLGPVAVDGALEERGGRRPERVGHPSGEPAQEQAVRLLPTIPRERGEPFGHHLRRNLDVAVTTARGQNLRRPFPIGMRETEAERAIEAVALDQRVDTSRDGAAQLVAGDGVTDDATPQVVDRELAVVRDADQRQRGQHRRRIDVVLADRTTQQVGVATADGRCDRQHVPLGVVEVIEHRLEHELLGPADAVRGGHRRRRRPPAGRRGHGGVHAVLRRQRHHLRRREQQLCFADLEHRSGDAQLRQPAHAVAAGQHEVHARGRVRHQSTEQADALVVSADVVHVVEDHAHPERPPPPQLGEQPGGRHRPSGGCVIDARRGRDTPQEVRR